MSIQIVYKTDSFLLEIDTLSPNERRMKPVVQLTKEGRVINTFPSIGKAERETKIRHIYECVSNKRKTAGGYVWRLDKGENYGKR